MGKPKKIAWESWNSKIEEFENFDQPPPQASQDEEKPAFLEESDSSANNIFPDVFMPAEQLVTTPIGIYPIDSLMRPSRRWDCWIGHTNFNITKAVAEKIELVEGVECLKILGRYSFFIGIATMFDIKDVRRDIHKDICLYTEEEILANEELQETVNLVKKQLEDTDYWSILVCPSGEVEYVSSDRMDQSYLDGLNELVLLKDQIGGIILRGTNG